jgi:hypothetical protein
MRALISVVAAALLIGAAGCSKQDDMSTTPANETSPASPTMPSDAAPPVAPQGMPSETTPPPDSTTTTPPSDTTTPPNP